jgi:hypothetical protein
MKYFRTKVCIQMDSSQQFEELLNVYQNLFYLFIQKTGGDEHDFNRNSTNITVRLNDLKRKEAAIEENMEDAEGLKKLKSEISMSQRLLRTYFQEFHDFCFSESNSLLIQARFLEYEKEIIEKEEKDGPRPIMWEQLRDRKNYFEKHYPDLVAKMSTIRLEMI